MGSIEAVDVDATIVEPASDASLLALGIVTSTGNVGDPPSQVDFTSLNQGSYHPKTGGQVS